jgi:phosphotransferase system enzyme I (PtsI)
VGGEIRGIGIGREAGSGHVLLWTRAEGLDDHLKSDAGPESEKKKLIAGIAAGAEVVRSQSADGDQHTQDIINALMMIIEDDELVSMAEPHLAEGWDGATALFMALDDLSEMMGDDEDFKSRVGDLRGIALTISGKIRGIEGGSTIPSSGRWVIVADDLTPVDTAQFGPSVVGVVTELGGPTSHTAIICRSRSIPAVVSAKGALELRSGELVLVDPAGNRVVQGGNLADATTPISFIPLHDEPLTTVRANIGSLADAEAAARTEARGVGLFRTEVLYLDSKEQPSRREQAEQFAAIFKAAPAGKITVRTIDAGSDKPVPFLPNGEEENPALGVRGFRLGLAHVDFQRDQLGAISDAIEATGRDVQVMAPMISTVEEARQFRQLAESVGLKKIGIMVETPAIVPMVPDLVGVVDFLSIGTNDLSQYLFAADRMHPAMGALVDPWQPGLLRTIDVIMQHAGPAGIPVGVCGESAADPVFSVVLAGMGLDSVSMAPSAVASVLEALKSVTVEQAQEIAQAALRASTPDAARAAAADLLQGA